MQHLAGENFSRGIIPQALARGIVVGLDQLAKALLGQGGSGMELVMPGELGAVVEGDTLALGREGGQDGSDCLGDGVSGLAWGAPGD